LALHAHRLAFTHPATKQWLAVCAPLPVELRTAMQRLGLEWTESLDADEIEGEA
jgi:hypothetical protein